MGKNFVSKSSTEFCIRKVLKSTGSAFTKFYRDEYTTLQEVDDRILSTSVELTYTFAPVQIAPPSDEKKLDFIIPLQKGQDKYAGSVWDEEVGSRARAATLETFATDESDSVQVRRGVAPYLTDWY